jgi:chemotaxis protein CheX
MFETQDEPHDAAVFPLPAVLDADAAANLANALCDLRYAPLTLDAAATRRVGAQGLQVLLSAARSWRKDGATLALVNLGDEARAQLRAMGIDPAQDLIGDINP